MYQTYGNSVGNNFKHVQITTKYRYEIMRGSKVAVMCRISIEEACKRHGVKIEFLSVLPDHVHLIVDCPRTISDQMLIQIIKGLSSYLLFGICPNLRKRYPTEISGTQDISAVQSVEILNKFILCRKSVTQ